jgi:pyrophosphatase PpaX
MASSDQPLRLAAIVFDLDGTLADNLPVVMQAYRQTFKQFTGRTYTDADIVALFGPNVEGIIRREVPDDPEEAVKAFYQAFDQAYGGRDVALPDMVDVLAALRQKRIRQAVVTGGSAGSAAITLKHLGLSDYFERVETGSVHGDRKAEAIVKVVADFGIEPCKAAYLGDSPHDVQAARQAGVAPLAAAWSRSAGHFVDALRHVQPLELFVSVAEFSHWLETHVDPHCVEDTREK